METDDRTPAPGLDDTVAAADSEPSQAVSRSRDRSPSQQRLHSEVRGRLFEGRAPTRSFEPGTLVAGRYRIVEHLGAGGMGEVFRARDLVLEEDVAVKFLPASRADDEAFMRRFVNEVRLARQISHPSVCRVHDIGEVDGRAFLSMEYIDGEDLASLLRRIGRLPPEKGYELAQQLCAGLSELHGAGLLHRDLKPANLMIDGQGRLKLADFGLAAVREELRAHEYGDGTPAYMSPEQLSGREVSPRSDIYALGVVLYELLSGRHPHEASDGPSGERGRIDRNAPTVALSARVTGLGSDTLEIIERCLEEDPQARPASVLDVAAALPGGDPIAAALRAGRAPSVDAVANVQSVASLRPWKAWLLASVTMMGFLLFALFGSTKTLWGRSAPQLAPAALEDRAKETLSDLGVALPTGSTMQRFLHDGEYLAREGPPMALASDGPVPVLYEFRASPGQLVRQGPVATKHDPPMVVPGEVRVVLDVHGHLRLFERVPEARTAEVGEPDWSAALKRAGVVAAHPAEPQDVPPRAVDVLVAWRGEMAGAQVLVEAAAWRGVPVWFRAKAPWSGTSERTISDDEDTDLVNVLVLLLFLVGLGLLARRSYKRGEVDGRGALRVAAVLGVSVTLSELMTMAVGRAHGFDTFFGMAQEGLLVAAISLLGYAVVEPYGRRFMPGAMVSWIRVTRGRWRDPLVGRDILVGAALGCVIGALSLARQFSGEGGVLLARLDALMGLRHAAGATLGAVSMGAFSVMQVYVLFLIIRWVTRRTSVAVGGFCLVWGLVEVSRLAHASLEPEAWAVGILSSLAISVVLAYTIVRVGLLGLSAAQVLLNLVLRLPISLELSGWYSTVSLVVLSATTVIVLGALYVALGRAQARERGGSTSRTRV